MGDYKYIEEGIDWSLVLYSTSSFNICGGVAGLLVVVNERARERFAISPNFLLWDEWMDDGLRYIAGQDK
jgi:hypothetical protein